jgi:hypothetical protein
MGDDIAKFRAQIDHGCDGPITSFVLIARACFLANRAKNETEVTAIANALSDALSDYGWLIPEGRMGEWIETGS